MSRAVRCALGMVAGAMVVACEGPPPMEVPQETKIRPLPPVTVSTAAADEADPEVLKKTFAERAKVEITEENAQEVATSLEKEIKAELDATK